MVHKRIIVIMFVIRDTKIINIMYVNKLYHYVLLFVNKIMIIFS